MIQSLYRRISTCALLCLLAVAAKAQIVYYGTPVTFPAGGGYTRYQFDFATGTYSSYATGDNNANTAIQVAGTKLFRFTVFNGDSGRTGVQLEFGSTGTKVVASGGDLSKLNFGTTIDGTTVTTNASSAPYINWAQNDWEMDFHEVRGVFAAGTPSYMGFSFLSGGETYYGWAKITVASNTIGLTINEWAYNSVAGESITVGETVSASAVPEPSTYAALAGLVALGATVVVRRRQQSPVAPLAA